MALLTEAELRPLGREAMKKLAKRIGDKMGVNWDNVLLDEFATGIGVELEHGGSFNDAAKVALDHLQEGKDYYTRLKKVEEGMEEPKGKVVKGLLGLAKSHVRAHTRITKTGGVTQVREHEDSRAKKKKAEDELEKFTEKIKSELGLESFNVYQTGPDTIKLYDLVVKKGDREGGKGTEAMKRLTAYADAHGKRITLTPDRYGSKDRRASVPRLKEFYKRFGFRDNTGRKKNYAISEGMYRNPEEMTKSHVRAHERHSKSGGVLMVRDYDDSRTKRAEPHGEKEPHERYGLTFRLWSKVRRGNAGEGHEIHLTKPEIKDILNRFSGGFISAGRNPKDPEDMKMTDAEIEVRHSHLVEDLKQAGFKFVNAKGKYGGLPEDTLIVMVPDAKKHELEELGAKYNQDSVLFWEKGHNECIYTTGKDKGKKNIGDGFQFISNDAEDFYTEVAAPSGAKIRFSLELDWDNLVKSLIKSILGAAKHLTKKVAPKYDKRFNHGRLDFQGMDISIENRKGSLRGWYNPDVDEAGHTRMEYPYGYIKGTEGVDGDHFDVFVGPHREAKYVYVVTTRKAPDFTETDEQKAMLGFRTPAEAKAAFGQHYDDPRFFGTMKAFTVEDFKNAVASKKGKLI